MNLIAREIFNLKSGLGGTNFEVGGYANSINTPQLLANKLQIDVSRITNFAIVGADVKCRISGSFPLNGGAPQFGFQGSYYSYLKDNDGLITAIGTGSFYASDLINSANTGDIILKNCLTIANDAFNRAMFVNYIFENATAVGANAFVNAYRLKIVYIPRVLTLGNDVLDNVTFGNIQKDSVIYCHPSLQTCNSGNPDGDLQYAVSMGAIVRYVTNFVAPSKPTNISFTDIYSTVFKIVVDCINTNSIDYYEVFINGIYYSNFKIGSYIFGLNALTIYQVSVVVVDVFLNKSVISEQFQVTTNNQSSIVTVPNLTGYYRLDGNSNDSFGIINGVDLNMAYGTGKIGQCAVFNKTSRNIKFNNSIYDIFGTQAYSFSLWINATTLPDSGKSTSIVSFEQSNSVSTRDKAIRLYSSGLVEHYGYDGGPKYAQSQSGTVTVGSWFYITATFGAGVLKIYVNSVLKGSVNCASTYDFSSPVLVLNQFSTSGTDTYFDGLIDEFAVFKKELTQNEINMIYNNGNGITL